MGPRRKGKQLIVVGDRVLVVPEQGEDKTRIGLYLPKSAIDKEAIQGGRIVACGPGTPMAEPVPGEDEPWKMWRSEPQYVPMQAREGDYALFFRRAAVEITYENKKYLIVPHAAILALIREPEVE